MYYRESDILVSKTGIAEEDVAAIDEYLFQNQGEIVRLSRLCDFTDVAETTADSLLRAYEALKVVSLTSVAICGRDDTPIEEPNEQGEYFCDICERTYHSDKLAFETVYVPRATKFEDGDTLPTSKDAFAGVDGIAMISGCSNRDRLADVVFVHGLDGDAISTWHPKNEPNDFFPKWLGEEFPNVGVWSLGYDASSSGWKGATMPLVDRATNVLAKLETAGIGLRPLIFVVHSLGGLVVKQIIAQANSYGKAEWEELADQIKGIVFIATPHSGSDISSYIKYIGTVFRQTITVTELSTHHPALRDLNARFRSICPKKEIKVECLMEKLPTNGFLVVSETSADPGLPGVIPIPIDADHITICKPTSKSDIVFARTRLLLQNVLRKLSV